MHVRLDSPLPKELAVGGGTALFVGGWCVSPSGGIRSLSFVVDGREQPVMAHGMPRLDVFRDLHPGLDPFETRGMDRDPDSADDPAMAGYRSGFWGIVRIEPTVPGERLRIALRAELETGEKELAEIGSIEIVALDDPLAVPDGATADGPLVAISMATYNPPLDLFRRQLDSIRAQTHRNWVCVVSDDCSDPRTFAELEALVAGDPRFLVSRSPRRLGFYRNFERALALAPVEANYVAMADQDDFWHADKIETLLRELGHAQLVYSDQRVIDSDGALRSDTYWQTRHNNHSDLLSLLVANSITGAASLFRRELLSDVLPFPPGQFTHFHDHWVGVTALALGEVAYVDRPLYDYVQHGEAVLGHEAANRMVALRERIAGLGRDPRERIRKWRMHYFVDICRLTQFATVLSMRCGDRMAQRKGREVERFLRAERSLPFMARLAGRGSRELVGRPETLGAEWMLLFALLWRRLLSATVRDRPIRTFRLDAVPPPALDPKPGALAPAAPGPRAVAEKIAPLELAERDDAPARVNLLIPTIDLEHFFGGYIAKLNLARRLAERGLRVRLVTVDPVPNLPSSWRQTVESYDGLDGFFDRVEVAFGREERPIEVSRDDRFIASTWWTAHIAHDAVRSLGRDRFVYLVQEYEPFTFPMGTFAALAKESYALPHFALFSTELLRDYFRRHGVGVYADGDGAGDSASVAFQNAITPVPRPSAAQLASRSTRRLLFYARPEPHAARNMFELGMLALGRALERGTFAGWELNGIGSMARGRRIEIHAGRALKLLPRSDQASYAALLREHDVGLSLMYTPHPSLVPIEMAAAGMLTVTNSFENKTSDALAAISPNLITAEPGIDSIASALVEAATGAEDPERRAAGSDVRWSRDWDSTFDDELLARVIGFLDA
jgi:glycosyltransferase involved in cell wall biosynthesis